MSMTPEMQAGLAALAAMFGKTEQPRKGRWSPKAKVPRGGPERSAANESSARLAFSKAGYGDTPREDRKTFNMWAKEGLRPKEGEKAIRPQGVPFALFHRSQCRPLVEGEVAQVAAQAQPKPVIQAAQPGVPTEAQIEAYLAKKASEAALKSEYGQ